MKKTSCILLFICYILAWAYSVNEANNVKEAFSREIIKTINETIVTAQNHYRLELNKQYQKILINEDVKLIDLQFCIEHFTVIEDEATELEWEMINVIKRRCIEAR